MLPSSAPSVSIFRGNDDFAFTGLSRPGRERGGDERGNDNDADQATQSLPWLEHRAEAAGLPPPGFRF